MSRRRRRPLADDVPGASASGWFSLIIMAFVLVAVVLGAHHFGQSMSALLDSVAGDPEAASATPEESPQRTGEESGPSIEFVGDEEPPASEAPGAVEGAEEGVVAPEGEGAAPAPAPEGADPAADTPQDADEGTEPGDGEAAGEPAP